MGCEQASMSIPRWSVCCKVSAVAITVSEWSCSAPILKVNCHILDEVLPVFVPVRTGFTEERHVQSTIYLRIWLRRTCSVQWPTFSFYYKLDVLRLFYRAHSESLPDIIYENIGQNRVSTLLIGDKNRLQGTSQDAWKILSHIEVLRYGTLLTTMTRKHLRPWILISSGSVSALRIIL